MRGLVKLWKICLWLVLPGLQMNSGGAKNGKKTAKITWCHIEQKIKPGNWLFGHITPQAMGKDMFDTFMAHPGVIPGPGGSKNV